MRSIDRCVKLIESEVLPCVCVFMCVKVCVCVCVCVPCSDSLNLEVLNGKTKHFVILELDTQLHMKVALLD